MAASRQEAGGAKRQQEGEAGVTEGMTRREEGAAVEAGTASPTCQRGERVRVSCTPQPVTCPHQSS